MSRSKQIKKAVGRPSTYDSSICTTLIEKMSLGLTDCQIFSDFGICRDTFYRWIREFPEFKEAHDKGLAIAETYWMEKGEILMMGNPKAFNFWIAFMNRKFKWSRNTTQDSQTQININNINILNEKSPTELIEYIVNEVQEQSINFLDDKTTIERSNDAITDQDSSTIVEDCGSIEDFVGQKKI